MVRRKKPRYFGTDEELEETKELEKASSTEISNIFNALGIDEDVNNVPDEEASVELWAKLDQEYSNDYETRVIGNEPVEGVVELTVESNENEETYLGRVRMGAQEIFSLRYMSNYGEKEPRGITMQDQQDVTADGEYQEDIEAD